MSVKVQEYFIYGQCIAAIGKKIRKIHEYLCGTKYNINPGVATVERALAI
ncbi:hypothetical protein HCJ39_02645 [Listeria rocourtiae]|nr:hypothetical protein [Listeria rocourtiae]MBC1434103.1 hypothetical protein [Listeria rocourtiae]MBC1603628.1 hypothetical protein [Listeria rocourtiae]